jgi:hypothetical protein
MLTRTLLLLATTLTISTVGVAGVAVSGPSPAASGPESVGPAAGGAPRAAAILRAWDHRRAVAWSHGDVNALSGLYTRRSRSGAQDAADLRRWHHRGLRVLGLRQQVAALRVRVDTSRRLLLTVTDRTVDAVAAGRDRRTALPRSMWTTQRIRLLRVHGRWLVDEVAAQPAR